MSMTPKGQQTAVPSSGGAVGLPFKTDQLFKANPGALAAFRSAVDARVVGARATALGVVITPATSIVSAIKQVCGSKSGSGAVRRILLSEGTWDFPGDGITIPQSDVEIIALSPNNTIFKQNARGAAAMITVTGGHFRIQGVSFYTSSPTAPAINVQGTNATVDACRFLAGIPLQASGTTTGLCIRDCEFESNVDQTVISLSGACNDALIVGNRIRRSNGLITLASNTAYRAVIVGNSFVSGGVIFCPYGYSHVVEANAAPRHAAYFTLADNTIAGTVSSYLTWPVATVFGVSIDFSLYRGATPDICTGRLDLVMNSAECLVYMDSVTSTAAPGVTFLGAISGGFANLLYTTTATGNAAQLELRVSQEKVY